MYELPLRLPSPVEVEIEIPRGGIIKRRSDGRLDFVSPLPCPFNYGAIPGTQAPDGDPLDAIVLGPRCIVGQRVTAPVVGVMGFVDRGVLDPKLVCADRRLTGAQRRGIERFFWVYVRLKRGLQRLRGQPEPTHVLGWLPWTSRTPRR